MNNEYIKPQKVNGFHFWCQKVIPLVFDDSLSYYEVLCKLTHFMNEFAESLNQTIDGLEELQEYFESYKEEINIDFSAINDAIISINHRIDEIISGSGELPVLEVSLNEIATNELESSTDEALKEILNEMLTNNKITPVILKIALPNENTTNEGMTCILNTDTTWVNSINTLSTQRKISLKGVKNIAGGFDGTIIYQIELFAYPEYYTINENHRITEIHAFIQPRENTFIDTSGDNSLYTPTSQFQPVNKKYVDNLIGNSSSTYTIDIEDLSNLTSDNISDLVGYLRHCYKNEKPALLIINTAGASLIYSIYDFNTFLSNCEIDGTHSIQLKQYIYSDRDGNSYMSSPQMTYSIDTSFFDDARITDITYYDLGLWARTIALDGNDVIYNNVRYMYKTDRYFGSSFTFDASNPRGAVYNISCNYNDLPKFSDGWYPVDIKHFFYNQTTSIYEEGAGTWEYTLPSNDQDGCITGGYSLSGTSLTDGDVYNDVLLITWACIDENHYVSWL